MKYSYIAGMGSYLPERVMTNAEVEKIVDTSNEWITQRTGITQRYIADELQTSASMAEIAASRALQNCTSLKAEDIQLIIVATSTPDNIFPSTACLLQERLNIPTCIAFDVSAACSGFVYALSIADQFIKTGQVNSAMVVGSELMTRLVDWQDRGTCILFGDGAGVFLLQAVDKPGIHSTSLFANGKFKDLLYVNNAQAYPHHTPYIKMKGADIFKFAVKAVSSLVNDTIAAHHLSLDQIDWIIPHQANERITEGLAKALSFPLEKFISCIHEHANTSAASIPLAFDRAATDGRIKRGDKVILVGFGGGMTWGSALLTY